MRLKVYLVDVDEFTGQITPNKVLECIKDNKIKNIKALLVMFHGGYPENSKKFYDIKRKYNFTIIEDACHALGAGYKYKNNFIQVGSCKHADVSTFSLHPVKTITTGEGGVITTNNAKVAKNIKLFRSHGIVRNKKKHWDYDILKSGYNYRISDINCALGLSQLKKVNSFIKNRKKIYKNYFKELKECNENLKLPNYSKNIYPAFHLFLINISFDKLKTSKDHFLEYLKNNNIICQFHYIPIYKFTVYTGKKTPLEGTEKYSKNTVSIPIFFALNKKNQKKIIKTIKEYLKT
jgi:dTDP-4-amino-4,6-dideoxygalactose transaminase